MSNLNIFQFVRVLGLAFVLSVVATAYAGPETTETTDGLTLLVDAEPLDKAEIAEFESLSSCGTWYQVFADDEVYYTWRGTKFTDYRCYSDGKRRKVSGTYLNEVGSDGKYSMKLSSTTGSASAEENRLDGPTDGDVHEG